MDHFFNIEGSVTYRSYNGYYITANFSYMSKLYLRTTRDTGSDSYLIDVVSKGMYLYPRSYRLDPTDDRNGITVNDRKYFGKDLRELAIKLQCIETEQAIEVLE